MGAAADSFMTPGNPSTPAAVPAATAAVFRNFLREPSAPLVFFTSLAIDLLPPILNLNYCRTTLSPPRISSIQTFRTMLLRSTIFFSDRSADAFLAE
jgi:hypothetical protein